MEKRSIKRRRLISSYVSPQRPDLPARFESLNDDTLTTVLEFVGDKSYRSFGGLNKQCKEVYLNTNGMTKETFVYGYAPLSVITDRYDRTPYLARVALSKGVVLYNRRDVLNWVLEKYDEGLLKGICDASAKEGRIDILDEVWNVVEKWDDRRFVFQLVDGYAAEGGKLNVLKWLENNGKDINKRRCAHRAAHHGHLHIIQWLKEERGLELDGGLYEHAIDGGGQLHVMKWLREQEVPWLKHTFHTAAHKGNLDNLQWLHDENCFWPGNIQVCEQYLKPEVIEWLRASGYGDRIWSL